MKKHRQAPPVSAPLDAAGLGQDDAGQSAEAWGWHSAYPAPAKLNLFLHVLGRRPDGYHELQSAFRLLDHGDFLHFSPRQDGVICLQNPLPGVPPEADLTVRAARLLQAASGCQQGVDIVLDKRLPMGGGLGGGSSDAATVLLALNHLWQLGLSRQTLQTLGLQLGADVPFFVFGQNAFAEGRGERLRRLDLAPSFYLVLEPPVQVPTARIFAAPELRRDRAPMSYADWQPGVGENDLSRVACAYFPEIRAHLDYLSRFGDARMSGSGACVFVAFAHNQQPAALDALAAVRASPDGLRGWLARGLAQHPLAVLASNAP
ncbi:MAG: 4-(cytidine 5'-diphospho)-2-C-methyl-D-erythritol kinase [Pseudomonadota bacterium]